MERFNKIVEYFKGAGIIAGSIIAIVGALSAWGVLSALQSFFQSGSIRSSDQIVDWMVLEQYKMPGCTLGGSTVFCHLAANAECLTVGAISGRVKNPVGANNKFIITCNWAK